jgi:hypothetical protein
MRAFFKSKLFWRAAALSLFYVVHAIPQEPTFLGGQRFELDYKETAAALQSQYQDIRREIDRLRALPATPCKFGDDERYKCVAQGNAVAYLPPFPLALPSNVPSVEGQAPAFQWVPAAEALNGNSLSQQWLEYAKAGTLLGCKGLTCTAIINGFMKELSNEEVLAQCIITSVGNTLGPPKRCIPTVLQEGSTKWVRVVRGYYTNLNLASAGTTTQRSFVISLYKAPLVNEQLVLTKAKDALEGPELRLDVQRRPHSVVGLGGERASVVQPGWREDLEVRVEVYSLGSRLLVQSIVENTLYVNRQNTVRRGDWHRPDDVQEGLYTSLIRDALKVRLESLCQRAVWWDVQTLLCDVSAEDVDDLVQ